MTVVLWGMSSLLQIALKDLPAARRLQISSPELR